MTAYCHHCKLPTFEGHPSADQCIAALRAELDRSEVWQDNQRLQVELNAKQRALEFAVLGCRLLGLDNTADKALAIAKGER